MIIKIKISTHFDYLSLWKLEYFDLNNQKIKISIYFDLKNWNLTIYPFKKCKILTSFFFFYIRMIVIVILLSLLFPGAGPSYRIALRAHRHHECHLFWSLRILVFLPFEQLPVPLELGWLGKLPHFGEGSSQGSLFNHIFISIHTG